MRNNIITSVLNKASVLLNFKEISLALLLLLVLASPGNLYAQDSDGDGVADTQDLDSDNDGILDADEGRCIANIGSIVVNTSSGEIASYNVETGVSTIICTGVGGAFDIAMPADASVYYLLTSAGGISSVDPSTCNSTFLEDVGGGTFNSLSILPDGTLLAGNTSGTVRRYDPVTDTTTTWATSIGGSSGDFCLLDGFIYYASSSGLRRITINPTNYDFVSFVTVGSLSGSAFGMTISASCQLVYGGGNELRVVTDPSVSSASTLITNSLPDFGNINGLTSIFEQDGCNVCTQDLDTDLDGIPDYLDLDSDGDGCSDALEGAGTFPISALQNVVAPATLQGGNDNTAGLGYNGTSTDPVLQNLGANSEQSDPALLGVPIVAPSTTAVSQGVGDSIDGAPGADCPSCDAGTTAPILSVNTLNNICPVVTGDLTAITASNTPAGTSLTWHTASPATTANLVANSSAVGAGTYHAAFYDAVNDCYSDDGNATTSVTVAIVNCCAAGDEAPRFN